VKYENPQGNFNTLWVSFMIGSVKVDC